MSVLSEESALATVIADRVRGPWRDVKQYLGAIDSNKIKGAALAFRGQIELAGKDTHLLVRALIERECLTEDVQIQHAPTLSKAVAP